MTPHIQVGGTFRSAPDSVDAEAETHKTLPLRVCTGETISSQGFKAVPWSVVGNSFTTKYSTKGVCYANEILNIVQDNY